jgi:ATP-dependent RNA helicase TDRD9
VYRLANNYYEESGENYIADDDDLNRSTFSLASTTRQLNSFTISPTTNKMVEKLSNPENLLKKLPILPITITEVIDCGHFWAQVNDGLYKQTLAEIQQKLNTKFKLLRVNQGNLYVGMLVITPYSDEANETYLYRAVIIDLHKDRQIAEVLFVDYGNKEAKKYSQLYQFSDESVKGLQSIQFQAFQCKLVNIEINRLKCPNGVWTQAAKEQFIKIISNKQFQVNVFSIVDNIVRVNLMERNEDETVKMNVNNELIKIGIAVSAEESHMSRQKNFILNKDKNNNTMKLSDSLLSLDLIRDEDYLVRDSKKPINTNEDNKYDGKFRLNGPYSPLEVTYHSVINIGKSKSVRIERDSINFVTLDDDPQNQFERMMVASQVTLNHSGE